MLPACIIALSCSKNEEISAGYGYWTLGNKQFNIKKIERSNANGYFILSGITAVPTRDTMKVYFSSIPTTSGKYKVIEFRDSWLLNTNEIGIKIHDRSTGTYYSTGVTYQSGIIPAEEADVTVNNGKITVEIPKMLTNINTSTYNDSVFLKAMVTENQPD